MTLGTERIRAPAQRLAELALLLTPPAPAPHHPTHPAAVLRQLLALLVVAAERIDALQRQVALLRKDYTE